MRPTPPLLLPTLLAAAALTPIAAAGCSSSNHATSSSSSTSSGSGGAASEPATYTDPAAVQTRLQKTLMDLAAMGSKRAGTDPGKKAGDYVSQRLAAAGFPGVAFESFSFLSYDLKSSALAVTVNGAAVAMKHDVFQYSGKGHVDADVVDVGTGHDTDYAGVDVTGKVVLVKRDPTFHREAQYRLVASHGGAAMLYTSTAPQNLIQIGTVDDPEDGLATIPTITVGADDGAKIQAALAAKGTAHAVIDVDASVSPSTGRNVVARLPGSDPSGAYVVVGAHYDTWYTGSEDNSAGTAVMLEVAEALAHGPKRKMGVVFVGYDGEELGLFGGYDYLRRHVIKANEPMLAFINLEMPGASLDPAGTRAMAHTNNGPLNVAVNDSGAKTLYTLYVGMEIVPAQFGGLIPTDIQGMYWSGLQGITTFCDTPYYHTVEDTPDKLDMAFLAQAAIDVGKLAGGGFDAFAPASFKKLDEQLWNPTVKTTPQPSGDLQVDVAALDAQGTAQPAAQVQVWVDVDDFTRAFKQTLAADAAGKATVMVPKAALSQGSGNRWLHVTAGQTFPLSERLSTLP